MSSTAPRRGFTLIELVVVIAIVAVLASCLFPVIASARRAGQRGACLGKMRQLTAAFLMYVGDHEEAFPDTGDIYLWMGRKWRPVIDAYVGDRDTYWCPQDGASRLQYDSTSYAYMQSFYHPPEDITAGTASMTSPIYKAYHTCSMPTAPQCLSAVAFPDRKILLYEWFSNHEAEQRTMWEATGLHMASFVDGHVAAVRQEEILSSAVGDHDPNWTIGGLGGKDVE